MPDGGTRTWSVRTSVPARIQATSAWSLPAGSRFPPTAGSLSSVLSVRIADETLPTMPIPGATETP